MPQSFKTFIIESSLSRIWQHVESNRDFGVVSAYRDEMSKEEKIAAHSLLKKTVRAMGYGFVEMRGGYNGDQGFVQEESLFIPNITMKFIIELGVNFQQHSVIHKSAEKFDLISTNRKDGIGKVLTSFVRGGKDSINTAKDAIKDFFSALAKGSHRGKKFVFNVEERESWSFNQAAYSNRGEEPKWFSILEWETE
jgi:hypothetical protein